MAAVVLCAFGIVAPAAARGNSVGITGISPAKGFRGDEVTLAGNGFGADNVRVTVGGVAAPVLAATGHSIRFTVPRRAPLGDTVVRITNPGGQTAEIGFRVRFDGVVSTTVDTAQSVTATVGPAGGTVAAGSATLTIPRGALADDRQITLTPLSSLDGSPFDRLVGGVKLGPDGLRFVKPATLTIQLPPGIDESQLLGFTFDGSGTEFHLVPSQVAGGTLSVSIWHFSGGGAVAGGASAVSTMLDYTPTQIAHFAEQQIALDINQLQNFGVGVANAGPSIAQWLELWYDKSVLSGLQAAQGKDEKAFEQAIGEWQAWLTDVELYGDLPGTAPFTSQTVHDVLLSRILQAESTATDDAATLAASLLSNCTGVGDFLPPLTAVFRLAGIVEVLGLDIQGRPAGGRTLPSGTNLPSACTHVVIEQVGHQPAFALDRTNTFTADAGTAFWNGPTRHDLPLGVELDDASPGGRVLASDTITTGHWETHVTPNARGQLPLAFSANLPGAQQDKRLAALGDGASFTVDVRDRITIGPDATLRSGDHTTLTIRVAGDGMAGAGVGVGVVGAGTLSAPLVTTDQNGTATVDYTAPPSTLVRLTDTVTASLGPDSAAAKITVEPRATVTITPQSARVARGGTVRFSAQVTGATDQSVTWNASGGTIDSTGLYTAGPNGGLFAVTAVSNADSTASATVVVEITATHTYSGQLTVSGQLDGCPGCPGLLDESLTVNIVAEFGNGTLTIDSATGSYQEVSVEGDSCGPFFTNVGTVGGAVLVGESTIVPALFLTGTGTATTSGFIPDFGCFSSSVEGAPDVNSGEFFAHEVFAPGDPFPVSIDLYGRPFQSGNPGPLLGQLTR